MFFLITAIVGGMFSGKFEDAQENETVSFLPGKAESVKSLEAVKRYPGGELAPAVIVYERKGGLTAADRRRVVEDQRAFAADRPSIALPPRSRCSPATATPRCSRCRSRRDRRLRPRSRPAMDSIRDARERRARRADGEGDGRRRLRADAIKVFGNINGTLLLRRRR